MSYRTRIRPLAARQIASWGLSDFVWTEVYLRLNEALPADPRQYLRREDDPFDGMAYRFSFIDPENRLCRHGFVFQVFFGADEETLLVSRGAYVRAVGI